MKAPNLRKWQNPENLEGLLFYSQIVDELLFDYTLDTYKLPALNSLGLLKEMDRGIRHVESGILKMASLRPILDEFLERVQRDEVIKRILGESFGKMLENFASSKTLSDYSIRTNYLLNKCNDSYFKLNIEMLKSSIRANNKKDIAKLSKSFLLELIHRGYSLDFVYFEANDFFFEGRFPPTIANVDIIDSFFTIFEGDDREWNIIVRVSSSFSPLKTVLDKMGYSLLTNAPSLPFKITSDRISDYVADNQKYPLFLVLPKFKCPDSFTARNQANSILLQIESLVRFHLHRGNFSWIDEVLTFTSDGTKYGICKRAVSPVLKRPEKEIEKLSDSVHETLNTILKKNISSESFVRLYKALQQHSQGIKSPTIESQLLQFWTAIEILFPPHIDTGDDKIVQICRMLNPFISRAYAAKLCGYILTSIKASGSKTAMQTIDGIKSGENRIEKLLILLSCNEVSSDFTTLLDSLKLNPLLQFHLFDLKDKFSTGENILKTLYVHEKRLEWQIQRIYRTRNLITHSGESLHCIDTLVENLHSYLDRVFLVLLEEMGRCSTKTSIESTNLEITIDREAHRNILEKNKKETVTILNYKSFLFGIQ